MLVSSSRLAVVGRAGSGVDNIDLVAAAELGVPVVNSPTGNTRSVAGVGWQTLIYVKHGSACANGHPGNFWWREFSFEISIMLKLIPTCARKGLSGRT